MKRLIKDIIIHCAATPNGKVFTVADIDNMHKSRGFKRSTQAIRNFNPEVKYAGYHFVICVNGTVEPGRGLEEIGAHVQGSNAKSIGICMIGTDKFSKLQFESLQLLVVILAGDIRGKICGSVQSALNALHDMNISIKGHRDYSPDLNGNGIIERNEWTKTCPGFSVVDWVKGGMIPPSESIL